MSRSDPPVLVVRLALRPWMILGALMLLMVGLRIFPGWHYLVRPDQEVRLPDPDAYYHYRQAAYTLEHYPRLLRLDEMSFYPGVLHNEAAGLYDLTLASLAKLVALFGLTPLRALWWVCLWFPPLCATAIMAFVYVLVRRQGTIAIGLAMALWYVLLPGLTLSHMTLGICDHHVVEMLVSVLCILLLRRLVERERERPSAWWRPAWAAALPLAILQFTWIGGPLFLVIFGLAGLGQLAADILAGAGARPMLRAGARYWLAFLILTGGIGLIFPDLILLADLWRLTLAGTAGVLAMLAMAGWLFETPRLPFRPVARLALGAGALVALACLLIACSPTVRGYVAVGLGHKSLLVAENQVVTAPFYFGVTGLAGILGLLAPVAGVVSGAWRRPAWWIGVLPSLFFIGLWYRSYDYGYEGALHAILLTGYFFGALAALRWVDASRHRAWIVRAALAVATAFVVFCGWTQRTAPLWLAGDWYEIASGLPSDGWVEAMRWLRTSTPAPPPLPAHPVPGQPPRGRAGVLTDWCDGNFVNVLADRPATASRYPTAEGMAPFFLQTEEAVRAAPLQGSTVARAVRYVALDPRTIGDSFNTHRETVGLRARDYYGRTTFIDGGGHTIGVPTLGPAYDAAFATRLLVRDGDGYSHFRLIFESRQQCFLRLTFNSGVKALMPLATFVLSEPMREAALRDLALGRWEEDGQAAYLGHLIAAVKIFEQVEGAKVEGTAPPGSMVALSVPLRLRTSGRVWRYGQSCRTDAEGRFQLTVPYSTEPAAGTDTELAGQATLFLEGIPAGAAGTPASRKVALAIPESAVQGGKRVAWRGWLGREARP